MQILRPHLKPAQSEMGAGAQHLSFNRPPGAPQTCSTSLALKLYCRLGSPGRSSETVMLGSCSQGLCFD